MAPVARHREEVLNVEFAMMLTQSGVSAAPEQVVQRSRRTRRMPDVLLDLLGLRCVIEGKYADASQARETVLTDARRRVEQGVAHLALALIYPSDLRAVDFVELREALRTATFTFAVVTFANFLRDPTWEHGTLDDVLAVLRRSHQELLSDDVVSHAVETLQEGMAGLTRLITDHPSAADRLITVVGILEPDDEGDEDA